MALREHSLIHHVLAHGLLAPPPIAWALRRLDAQRRWLRDPHCPHSGFPRFQPQVVHGGYHDAKLFFEADRVSAIIDWEQAALLLRA